MRISTARARTALLCAMVIKRYATYGYEHHGGRQIGRKWVKTPNSSAALWVYLPYLGESPSRDWPIGRSTAVPRVGLASDGREYCRESRSNSSRDDLDGSKCRGDADSNRSRWVAIELFRGKTLSGPRPKRWRRWAVAYPRGSPSPGKMPTMDQGRPAGACRCRRLSVVGPSIARHV